MAGIRSVLVLGAAELGTAVIEALASHSNCNNETGLFTSMRPSSINSPSSSKQAQIDHLRALNVQPIALDVEAGSLSELAQAFASYDAVICCTGMAGSPGLQMKLAQAILEAKTPRYIPWQFGVDYDVIGPEAADGLFASQCDVRHLLRSSGQQTRSVIISTGIFMSFLFENLFGIVECSDVRGKLQPLRRVRALGNWQNKITATTAEDIGRCTAEVLFNTPAVWQDSSTSLHVVHVAGDTVTFEGLANILHEITTAGSIERQVWSTEFLQNNIHEEPENAIHKYRMIWAENRGVAWDVAQSFNGQKGIAMTTIRDWAKRTMT